MPLSLFEGSTENATLVTELIVDLRERGLDVTRPVLVVLDGSKALRRAVLDVFDSPVLARCQLHKIRNVRDKLPQRLRPIVGRRMCAAYHAETALQGEGLLTELARALDTTHPSAATSLREGLPETLTVLRLGLPPTLTRTLRSTNGREHDLDLPGALEQRHPLARGPDGLALVRCRDDRGRQAVPPRQRPPAPTGAPRRDGPRHRRYQQCRTCGAR